MARVFQITIFLFLSFAYSAQVPGYFGKRFVLGYGANISPALINGNAHNKTILGYIKNNQTQKAGSAKTGSFAFNYTHDVYLEYVLSTRFMCGFSGKFYNTTYDNTLNTTYSQNASLKTDQEVQGYYSISGKSIALYGKLYNKHYVAPWGKYIIFGPVINLYKTSYDSTIMYQTQTSYNTNKISNVSDYGELNQSFTGFNIIIGYGCSRIIRNRIIIDYGINAQLFSMISLISDYQTIASNGISHETYISKTSGIRIRGLNRFNAFIKVGFLIF